MSYCPDPLNFKCQISNSYPHVQWFNCASEDLREKMYKMTYTQGSMATWMYHLSFRVSEKCLRVPPLCLFVVPQPPGAASQCISGHQGLHSERLQWRHHLQIPNQVSSRAGQQGEFQMRVWGDIWCITTIYVGAHPMRHCFFLKIFNCVKLKGIIQWQIKLSMIFWNKKVNVNIL